MAVKVEPAHNCNAYGSLAARGKHRPSEFINPELGQRDYCEGCLRVILYVEHATFLGMDWIKTTLLEEWP